MDKLQEFFGYNNFRLKIMDKQKLNALKDRAYKTAIAHGFHEEERPDAYWLGLVMSEMGEAISADQKGLHANVVRFVEDMELGNPFKESFEVHIKDSLEDELSDIVIRLFDFAGLKRYELDIDSIDHFFTTYALPELNNYKLPGILVSCIALLADALREDELCTYVGTVICVLSDWFKKITGRDYDLWWFVEQKMKYNELRPKLNGKKY